MKIKAKVKVQLECIVEAWIDENDITEELTFDELIEIIDVNDIGDFDVIDWI